MNWIIQGDYNEYDELSEKNHLSDYEKNRMEELAHNIFYYESTYGKGSN
ncbi:MAG TPA: hypothetical protein P5556_02285 [Candidatus Gastranaerophilales bacterium]|nr:hypothetical protein [Candidatus Gastranaerophilales bacterium]